MSALTRRRTAALGVLLLLASVMPLIAAPAAMAALGGLTAFEIDGDTEGATHDWASGPGGTYNIVNTVDYVGEDCAYKQDDQIVGGTKLDDPWHLPEYQQDGPSQVHGKDDLCQVWTGFQEAPNGDVIFYFAWDRRTTEGESNVYVPLDTPPLDQRNAGDLLVKFEYDSNTGDTTVSTKAWVGDGWGADQPLNADEVDAAVSDGTGSYEATQFGEAAVNLTTAGILPTNGDCLTLVGARMLSETGQGAANPQLKDIVDLAVPVEFNTCGTIVVEKMSYGDVGTFYFESSTLDSPSFSLTTETVGVGVTETFPDLQPGTYDVAEVVESLSANWALTSATCDDGSDPSSIDLAESETVTCTFENTYTPPPGTIIVEKVTTGGVGTFQFTSSTLDSPSFSLTTETVGVGVTETFSNLDAGTYDVVETPPASPNWSLASSSCDDGSDPGSIDLAPGETVKCTFNNAYTPDGEATLIVEKVVQGEGAPAISFDIDVDTVGETASISLADGETQSFTYTLTPPLETATVAVSVTEDTSGLDDNWTDVSISCTDETTGESSVEVTLGNADLVTCTITNVYTPDGSARLTVEKVVQGEGAPAISFDIDVDTVGETASISLANGESQSFTYTLPVGTDSIAVSVSEDTSGLDDNWTGVSISCTDETTGGSSVEVTLANGDDVTCTITNVYTPDGSATVRVVKQVNSGAPSQSFDFSATDKPDFSLSGGGSTTLTYAIPVGSQGVAVTVTEDTGLPSRWAFKSVSCELDSEPTGETEGASAAVTLTNGDAVTCTFVNEYTPPRTTTTTTQPQTASVGDLVWNDINGNGVQDPGEPGIPGVTVELIDEDGNVVATTTTDANGNYLFEDVEPGTYQVRWELPDLDPTADEVFTLINAGDDFFDSDADVGGITDPFEVGVGVNIVTIDAGVAILEVAGTTISAETLPFTGGDFQNTALAAALALAGGLLLILSVRRDEDEAVVGNRTSFDSWNSH